MAISKANTLVVELQETAVQKYAPKFASALEEVAPDLKSYGLAKAYSNALFGAIIDKLENGSNSSKYEIMACGMGMFYTFGKDVIGPLAVKFVDTALKDCSGIVVFPARDATPFWHIAKTLVAQKPEAYAVAPHNLLNPAFNRKMWGIDDEQDSKDKPLSISDPLVMKLLEQMGFASDSEVSFVEVGCWGSMIHQLKDAMAKGQLPHKEFKSYFFYTHLPEYIYGYTNIHGGQLPDGVLETIADTWEAFPKCSKRATKLVEENSIVTASLEGTQVDPVFLGPWTVAALHGVVDAAHAYVVNDAEINPVAELHKLLRHVEMAKHGVFTGMLPDHTETWSEGESWKEDWRWGKIPPLR